MNNNTSNNTENALGFEKIPKLITSLVIPAVAGQVVNMLYNIIDRIFIGRIPDIGQMALTGVGVTFPIIIIIAAFSSLIGFGGYPKASIKMGQKDYDGAEQILGNCVSLLLYVSVILTVFLLLFHKKLLMMFGASIDTIGYASEYIQIYVLGTIFVELTLGLNGFISTQGFAKISMYTVLIGAITNIVLDPILIFGFKLGVKGAALATIISQAISVIWVLRFLTSEKGTLRIKKKYLKVKKEVVLPVLALGVSPFIMQSTESLLSVAFNSSLQKYGGDLAVGSMTILNSLMQFVVMPLQGIGQGVQPIISYNFGAKNKERVIEAFKYLVILSVAYSVIFWALMEFAPMIFTRIFTTSSELVEMSAWALRIYMFGIFFFGAQIACQQAFLALGQAKVSLFLALLRKIILLIPLILILPFFFEDKVFAVFLSEPISDIVSALVTILMFCFTIKKLFKEIDK